MKKIIIALLLLIPFLCFGQAKVSSDIEVKDKSKLFVDGAIASVQEDSIKRLVDIAPLEDEYEVVVLDPGYETFLITQKPKEFYSESSLKVKNSLMVNEWNYRYSQPMRYNPGIYEVSIDYDTSIKYGLEFEYRLYMFFKFIEKQHGIRLLN